MVKDNFHKPCYLCSNKQKIAYFACCRCKKTVCFKHIVGSFKEPICVECNKNSSNKYYNKEFYSKNYNPSYLSAQEVIPIIIKKFNPQSIVDLGCGSGTWVKVFKENGVREALGVDFHNENIIIPKDNFMKHDLRKNLSIDKKFDIAISLEVAEHIDNRYSELFVDNIIKLSDVVVFSAATPKQEGENHINEQWHNFWVEIFENRGYVAIDLIRPYIILNEKVSMDYRQNIIVFVKESVLQDNPTKFIAYFDKSKQLLFRKSCAKQMSYINRVAYRINKQYLGSLFNGVIDKIFLKKFFGDIALVDTKQLLNTKEGRK